MDEEEIYDDGQVNPVSKETAGVSVRDKLKLFNGNTNNSNNVKLAPPPPLTKKPVLPHKPVVAAKVTKCEPPPDTPVKPEKPAPKPKKFPSATTPNDSSLLHELKARQASIKPKQSLQPVTDQNGDQFTQIKFTPPRSAKPNKPESIEQCRVNLPTYSYEKCNGCCQANGTNMIDTNILRPSLASPGSNRKSERIKSLTEEEELERDFGGSGMRIAGAVPEEEEGCYDDATVGARVNEELEENYDTCEPVGSSNNHSIPNGEGLKRGDREKSKKNAKVSKKQEQEKEKMRHKEIQEQDKLKKKYKLSEEELASNHIVRCKESISEGKHLCFSLNAKQSVFLVRKIDSKKWIIKNPQSKVGIVDANKMEDLEDIKAEDADEGEDFYDSIN